MSIYSNPLYLLHIYRLVSIYQSPNTNNQLPLINLSRSQNNKLTTQLPLINSSLNNSINTLPFQSSSITDPHTKVIINCNKYEIHELRKIQCTSISQHRIIKID